MLSSEHPPGPVPEPPSVVPTSPLLPFLRAGDRWFDRFRLLESLGRGGMGVVWKAHDERLDEPVALKFLPDPLAADPRAVADLRAETRRARLLSHPNIVRIHDFFSGEHGAAVSMEFVPGSSLAAVLAEKRLLSPQDILAWLPGLCAALDYAHREVRLVHRDIKPGNILITESGSAKLGDFGISCRISESATRSTHLMVAGTLAYMSPQQAMGDDPVPADDIYALGAMLYELIAGRPPFSGGDVYHQIIRRRPQPPVARRPVEAASFDACWDRVVLQCLAKHPRDRPESAGAVVAAITGQKGPRVFRSTWWRVAWAGLGALALAAAVGAFLLSRATPLQPGGDTLGDLPRTTPDGLAPGSGIPAQLVLHYPFDGDNRDAVVGREAGRVLGATLVAGHDGRNDTAFRLGSVDAIELGDPAEAMFGGSEPFAISLWIRPRRTPDGAGEVVSRTSDVVGALGYRLVLERSTLTWSLVKAMGTQTTLATGQSVQVGIWQHVVVQSTGCELQIYFEGPLVGAVPSTQRGARAARGRLVVGRSDSANTSFEGEIDDLRFFRGSLDANAIGELRAAGIRDSSAGTDAPNIPALLLDQPPPYAVSQIGYSERDDLDAIIREEFGPGARLADWEEVKRDYSGRARAWAQAVGLQPGRSDVMVTRGGARFFDERRQYVLARTDGNVPGYAMVHDDIDGQTLILGSWYDLRTPLLVRLADTVGVFGKVDFSTPELPAGWSLRATGGGAETGESGASEGRLWARAPDGRIDLDAVLSPAPMAQALELTWRGTLVNALWGAGHEVRIDSESGGAWRFGCARTGEGREILQVVAGPVGSPSVVREILPGYGDLAFTLLLRDDAVIFRAVRESSGRTLFQEAVNVEGLRIASLRRLVLSAFTTTSRDVWIDDVSLRIL